jgi:hypothetical protein
MRWLVAVCLPTALACDASPAQPVGCPSGELVVTSDEQNVSSVGVLPLDGSAAQLLGGASLGGDPALSVSTSGAAFFLARDRDVIYAVDSCGRGTAQYSALASAESKADPLDLDVAADGSLWISRWLQPSLLVLDPSGSPSATIDLSALDADGNPDQGPVRVVQTSSGEKAFVALERLDDTQVPPVSTQPSQMAIVDTASRALEAVVTLAGRNPVGHVVEHGGLLWLADMGNTTDDREADAGIEVFSPETRSTRLLLSEVALGGSLTFSGMAIDGAGCGAAIVMDASSVNHTSLVTFDVSGRVVQSPAFGPTSGYDLWALGWASDGRLLVGDRSQPGASSRGFAVTRGTDLYVPMAPVAFALPP